MCHVGLLTLDVLLLQVYSGGLHGILTPFEMRLGGNGKVFYIKNNVLVSTKSVSGKAGAFHEFSSSIYPESVCKILGENSENAFGGNLLSVRESGKISTLRIACQTQLKQSPGIPKQFIEPSYKCIR
jgi:hypothetical protein